MNPDQTPRLPFVIRAFVVLNALFVMLSAGYSEDRTYTGGALPGTTASGDTVLISGAAAASDITLSDGQILQVGDWIDINGNMNLTGKTDITFEPATNKNKWAVMEYTGATNRIISITGAAGSAASGTQTITFNNVVLKGGRNSPAGGLYYSAGAGVNNELIIDGNVAFIDNAAGNNVGGAISGVGALTFTGTTIFDRNKAGWNSATGEFDKSFASRGGGAVAFSTAGTGQQLIFKDTAIFVSNTAGGFGGAIAAASNVIAITFEGMAKFYNNYAGAREDNGTANGGAVYVHGAGSSITFSGGAEIKGNRAFYNGAAIYIREASLAIENGGYYIADNQAQTGGAIYVHTAGSISIDGSGTFRNNVAANGGGGAIFTVDNVSIGSGAVFDGNMAGNLLGTALGGAIMMNAANKTITLSAQTDDIVFKGNRQSVTIATDAEGEITATGGNSNAIYYAQSGTLVFDAAAGRGIYMRDSIAAHATSAAGMIVQKKGAGEVVFSDTTQKSDIVAKVTVEEGAFVVADNVIFGRASDVGSFTVKSGATLAGGNGTIQSGTITIESGANLEARRGLLTFNTGSLAIGTGLTLSGVGSIKTGKTLDVSNIHVGLASEDTLSSLTLLDDVVLADNAILQFDLGHGDYSDHITAKNITLANRATIDLTWTESGSFTLVTWEGATGFTGTNGLSITANGASLTARNNATLYVDTTAKELSLVNIKRNLGLTWTGAEAGRVWKFSPIDNANWADNGGTGEKYFVLGDSVTFGTAGSGTVTVEGLVAASEMNVIGGDYVFAGVGDITTATIGMYPDTLIVGSGTSLKLKKTGDGVLAFANTGTNTFTGGIEIGGGALAYQNAAHLRVGVGEGIVFAGSGTLRADASTTAGTGTLATNINVGAGKTATFDTQGHTVGYAGTLSGADATAAFAKAGSGELTLHANNSAFTGTTRVREGALMLASDARLGGMIFIENGATFGGSGSAAGITTVSGAIVQAGIVGTANVFSTGALNMAGGSIIRFNLLTGTPDVSTSVNSKIEVGSGNVTLLAGGNMSQYTINLSSLITGKYDIGNIAGLADARVTYGNNIELSERQGVLFDVTTNPGRLHITVDAGENDALYWTGSVGAFWAMGKNWLNPTSVPKPFIDGDVVVFRQDGDNPRLREIDINNNLIVSDMRVEDAQDYRFYGVGGITANPAYGTLSGGADIDGKLKKTGAGAITFENTGGNAFMGGIDISAGMIAFTDGSQISTAAVGGDAGISFLGTGTLRAMAGATMANTLDIEAGQVAVFDISDAGHVLWHTGTFAPASSGTLVKMGGGGLSFGGDNSAHNGEIAVRQGVAGLSGPEATLGGTVHVDSGAGFGGAGEMSGCVTLSNGGALLVGFAGLARAGADTLTVASLRMENGSRLAGSGTLVGSGTIGGAAGGLVTADIDSGAKIAITAALAGSGTILKVGDGVLEYGSDAALGHAATQIDAGVVMLRNIVNPGAAVHDFIINGGWLDLSETSSPTKEWSADLRLSGDTGRVIGKNDQITLTSGSYAFQIGGTTTETQGVYVVIDAQSGTVTLTGENTYAGLTRIKSGVLSVSADANLGSPGSANRDVVLEGGNLHVSEGFVSNRSIELRAETGNVEVAKGITSTWAGTKGEGSMTKSGAGTLKFTGTLANVEGVTVTAGVLEAPATGLIGVINNLATINIDQASGTGTLAGTILGNTGIVNKVGGGTLVLDSVNRLQASTFALKAGVLELRDEAPFTVGAQFQTVMGSQLWAKSNAVINVPLFTHSGEMRIGKAAGADGYGAFTIQGAYNGYGKIHLGVEVADDKILNADKLIITGSATGESWVYLAVTKTPAVAGDAPTSVPLIETDGSSALAFQFADRQVLGAYELILASEDKKTWMVSTQIVSPELPAVLGADVAPILIGKASLDSLAARLSVPRINEIPHRHEIWANGLHRFDRLSSDNYDGTDAETQGIQAGMAIHLGGGFQGLVLGIFCDRATADLHLNDGISSTETISNGRGSYLSFARGAWYANAIVRYSKEDYTIAVPGTVPFETKGESWAGSFEAGYSINDRGAESIVPYVRIAWQSHTIDETTDSFERTYKIDSADSFETRVGVRVWEAFDWTNSIKIIPYAKAALSYEFKGETRVRVDAGRDWFSDNKFDGAGLLLEGGAALQLGRRFAINLEGSWYIGEKMENYTINLGARYVW